MIEISAAEREFIDSFIKSMCRKYPNTVLRAENTEPKSGSQTITPRQILAELQAHAKPFSLGTRKITAGKLEISLIP